MIFPAGLLTKVLGGVSVALFLAVAVQEFRVRGYRADLAEERVKTVRLSLANESQATLIAKLTQDKAAFDKRAREAEAALARAEAEAETRITVILKRLEDEAQPQDNDPVAPAVGRALDFLRQ